VPKVIEKSTSFKKKKKRLLEKRRTEDSRREGRRKHDRGAKKLDRRAAKTINEKGAIMTN